MMQWIVSSSVLILVVIALRYVCLLYTSDAADE